MKSFIQKNWVYLIGFVLSIILIILDIKYKDDNWGALCGDFGIGLFSAIILGWCLELQKESAQKKHNKKVFQIVNSNIYSEIYSLLMIIYLEIKEINKILKKDKNFKYQNITIEELLNRYIEEIKYIKANTAPTMLTGTELSEKDVVYNEQRKKCEKVIKQYNDSLQEYRKKFHILKEKFDINKNIFLISGICSEEIIIELSAILNILETQSHNKSTNEGELIEFGNSFEELLNCKFTKSFNSIGFDKIRFNNLNGYFGSEVIKG